MHYFLLLVWCTGVFVGWMEICLFSVDGVWLVFLSLIDSSDMTLTDSRLSAVWLPTVCVWWFESKVFCAWWCQIFIQWHWTQRNMKNEKLERYVTDDFLLYCVECIWMCVSQCDAGRVCLCVFMAQTGTLLCNVCEIKTRRRQTVRLVQLSPVGGVVEPALPWCCRASGWMPLCCVRHQGSQTSFPAQ